MRIRLGSILLQTLLHGSSHAAAFTFFATSDMHYGLMGSDRGGDREEVRAGMPSRLNGLPGTLFPGSGNEVVARPKGILVPGDLVHWEDTVLWRQYVSDYAVAGDGKVAFPIYDGTGNHDVESGKNLIAPLFVERNATRKARFGLANTDSLGYHYSWEWEGVHFINLNLTPGSMTTANFWNGPARSIAFLKDDLSRHVGASGRPVFIMHHLPYNDTTYTPDFVQGWIPSARAEMIEALKGYNCIGILHGQSGADPARSPGDGPVPLHGRGQARPLEFHARPVHPHLRHPRPGVAEIAGGRPRNGLGRDRQPGCQGAPGSLSRAVPGGRIPIRKKILPGLSLGPWGIGGILPKGPYFLSPVLPPFV